MSPIPMHLRLYGLSTDLSNRLSSNLQIQRLLPTATGRSRNSTSSERELVIADYMFDVSETTRIPCEGKSQPRKVSVLTIPPARGLYRRRVLSQMVPAMSNLYQVISNYAQSVPGCAISVHPPFMRVSSSLCWGLRLLPKEEPTFQSSLLIRSSE